MGPLTEKLLESIESFKFVLIAQEYQESLIQGKIYIQGN